MYEHPLRLLNGSMDTSPVAHKGSFYSGTPDIAPRPNADSHETGEGNHNSKGHEVQNAIMGIIDQSMCCFENFPLCVTVTEAPLALSFPQYGPYQGTNCHPTLSTGQDSGRLVQTAHALSFSRHGPGQESYCHHTPNTGQNSGSLLQIAHTQMSFQKHGPDIRLLATSGVALLQFAKSFCMTLQPARQVPGIRMAEGRTAYGRLQPVRRPWF